MKFRATFTGYIALSQKWAEITPRWASSKKQAMRLMNINVPEETEYPFWLVQFSPKLSAEPGQTDFDADKDVPVRNGFEKIREERNTAVMSMRSRSGG